MSKNILFVGAFNKRNNNFHGGQIFACNSLINSDIRKYYNWDLIDTTSRNNLKSSIFKRIPNSFYRLIRFLYLISTKRYHYILIFSSNGYSFKEKGLMALLGSNLNNAKIIFAPRSGRLIDELNKSFRFFEKLVFNSVDQLICQGESWKFFFLEHLLIDKSKLIVQKNWIDIKNYKKSLGGYKSINILFLGWIDKEKGIFDLCNVIYKLKNELKNINFILNVAGRGNDENKLKYYIENKKLNSHIKLLGWISGSDKLKLLSKSDLFVLPSYYEGMPNSLIEAMASGLACVAYDTGGIKDVLNNDNGLLIRRGNIVDLKKAIKSLLINNDLRNKLKTNARSYAIDNHSIEQACKNFKENIFN